jgi:hypothetical protein
MEFPPAWNVVDADQFASAQPRAAGQLGMDLLVQARPNGRMLDHYRVTLGGSRILDVCFNLSALVAAPRARTWRIKMQLWPRDVDIRRNMTTTTWMDVSSLVASRECAVLAVDGGEETAVSPEEYQAVMTEAGAAAAFRFAVVIGGDQRMALALQGLPASADLLLGKPAFRG